MANAICARCGREFNGKLRQGRKQKFCSRLCFRGKPERKRVNELVIVKCDYCGKTIIRPVCHVSQKNYCSRSCSAYGFWTWHQRREKKYCLECGKEITSQAIYCGHCCKSGDKAYNWRGGITPVNTKIRLSPKYLQWREQVMKRDGYKCTKCGDNGHWKKETHKRTPLEVHHIKPFSTNPELRFDLTNAITLCRTCHRSTTTYKELHGN